MNLYIVTAGKLVLINKQLFNTDFLSADRRNRFAPLHIKGSLCIKLAKITKRGVSSAQTAKEFESRLFTAAGGQHEVKVYAEQLAWKRRRKRDTSQA